MVTVDVGTRFWILPAPSGTRLTGEAWFKRMRPRHSCWPVKQPRQREYSSIMRSVSLRGLARPSATAPPSCMHSPRDVHTPTHSASSLNPVRGQHRRGDSRWRSAAPRCITSSCAIGPTRTPHDAMPRGIIGSRCCRCRADHWAGDGMLLNRLSSKYERSTMEKASFLDGHRGSGPAHRTRGTRRLSGSHAT